jgi:hypothetical protein
VTNTHSRKLHKAIDEIHSLLAEVYESFPKSKAADKVFGDASDEVDAVEQSIADFIDRFTSEMNS